LKANTEYMQTIIVKKFNILTKFWSYEKCEFFEWLSN